MNVENRLSKLETQATALPPNGALLRRQYEALPAGTRCAWLERRSDDELEALVSTWDALDGDDGINWDQFTDEELERIADGIDWRRVTDAELERIRDGYLSPLKGEQ